MKPEVTGSRALFLIPTHPRSDQLTVPFDTALRRDTSLRQLAPFPKTEDTIQIALDVDEAPAGEPGSAAASVEPASPGGGT
mgnify:CR=1 FL=1